MGMLRAGGISSHVSHDGVVYQKDLGRRTAQTAHAMKANNPEAMWTEIGGGPSKR